jgi:3-deoxy-D-manno-octulosonic-acid transferase
MPDPFLWRRRFVLLIYNGLLPLALLWLLPSSLLKMRKRGGYGRNFWQRLGIFNAEAKARLASGPQPIWLHAVSVGEVGVARKLIKELVRLAPERPLVLSTTTSTGYAVAVKDLPAQVTVIYSPVDFLWVVSRVLKLVRPEKIVFVEAEVWPNLTCLAKRRGVHLCLANARLSPRSGRRYAKFKWFVEPIFALLDKVCVQFPDSVERWQAIGARPEAIVLTGSVKYDEPATKPGRSAELRAVAERCWPGAWPELILGASTFPQEEVMLGKVMLELRAEFPNLKLILVPRHVERAAEVVSDLNALGLKTVRRTASEIPEEEPDVLLVDTTGELRDWQQLPSVVVIGKSFYSTGGQNPVEAIAAGTPVLTGPKMENFSLVMKLLLEAKALSQLDGPDALCAAVRDVLRNPDKARLGPQRGQQALAPHRGAAKRTAETVVQC